MSDSDTRPPTRRNRERNTQMPREVAMSTKISPARQRNAVSQGIALGLCMLERYELRFEKLRGTLIIHQRGDDWDSDNPNDVEYALSMVDGDVPLEGWVSLARDFLTNFDREYG